MSRPEHPGAPARGQTPAAPVPPPRSSAAGATPGPVGSRYGWFVGVVALLVVALITLNTVSTTPNGGAGVAVGQAMPPFAVPLAVGMLQGDANVATRANAGAAGRVPACSVMLPSVLNICRLYRRGPVVLALFVASGNCPAVLDDLQRERLAFPGVQFAAVAIRGDRRHLAALVRAHRWSFPVGYDHDGALANLYKVSSCPQITFARRGGVVGQPALLTRPPLLALRARLRALLGAAAGGASGPA